MRIAPEILHDLKTERAEVLPPLPIALRLVPILFYLAAFATILLASVTIAQIGQATGVLEGARQRATDAQTALNESKIARSALEARAKRASDVLRWVEGSVNVQPLAVSIARSTGEQASIIELALTRSDTANRQIQLALRLQANSTNELEPVLAAIRAADFRPFSAQQSQAENEVNYEASLIRQVDRPLVEEVSEQTPAPQP
ncbi:MAG: hypothetical protein WA771_14550 [Chthoniobacterales bacterium]